MKNIFWLAVLNLFFLNNSFAGPDSSKKVILFIDLFGENSINPGKPENLFAEFQTKMSRFHPQQPIRPIFALNTKDFKEQCMSILKDDEVISHLYLATHGNSSAVTVGREDGEEIKCDCVVLGFGEEELIHVYHPAIDDQSESLEALNSKAIDLFTGIRGRFMKGAKVELYACRLLAGDSDSAMRKAMALRHVLDLKEGTLFGLSTEGHSIVDLFTAPWNQRGKKMLFQSTLRQGAYLALITADLIIYFFDIERGIMPYFSLIAAIGFFPNLIKYYFGANKGYVCDIKDADVCQLTACKLSAYEELFVEEPS